MTKLLEQLNQYAISGVSQDSRLVKSGDLFFALQGETVDGRAYIEQAIEKGVRVILVECLPKAKTYSVPIIEVPDLKNKVGEIAAHFLSNASRKLPVIGVTGTNGKTSCVHFIAQLLKHCGKQCGIIGTLGVGFLEDLTDHQCTTPDAVKTQMLLKTFCEQAADAVAMEVTSHALVQGRVNGVQFQTAIFTNLTRDHLDYHLDMDHYFAAKETLFTELKPASAVINLEDAYGRQLMSNLIQRGNTNCIGYTTEVLDPRFREDDKIVYIESLELKETGFQGIVKTPWGEGVLDCHLLGRFNLSNILAALTALCLQGIPLSQLLAILPQVQTVPGRMMRLGGVNGEPLVVIDYAHTPDALFQLLTALRPYCRGQLWCVFGCGGDRDRGKRPQMAEIAERISDKVILTQDNSRTESPLIIIQEIMTGFKKPNKIHLEMDRKQAIQFAIKGASAGDVVVIAGKGHENYQIFGQEKRPFSDMLEAKAALQEKAVCAN